MEINDIRSRIDAIDDELVALFVRRMDCSREIARAKQQAARPLRDHARERAIVNRLTAAAGDDYAPYVKSLYAHIFDLSRSYQSSVREHTSPLAAQIVKTLVDTKTIIKCVPIVRALSVDGLITRANAADQIG